MSQRIDPYDLIDIEQKNILSRQRATENQLASSVRSNLEIDSLEQVTTNIGSITYYGTDDDGNIRLVISPVDLFEEYGVHSNVIWLEADETTISMYVDLETDIFTTPEGTPGSGDVISNSTSSVRLNVPLFDDADGKHIADNGLRVSDLAPKGGLFYLDEAASDIGGYKTLQKDFSSVTSGSTTTACVAGGVYDVVEEFSSLAIDMPIFFAGVFTFEAYFSTNVNQDVDIYVEVYLRTSGGTETLLLSVNAPSAISLTGTPTKLSLVDFISTTSYAGVTDRIVIKIMAQPTSNANIIVTFGSTTYPAFFTVPYFPNGNGDMPKSVYDPQTIEADAFDTDNHTDGVTNGVYTLAERSKLAGIEDGASNVLRAKSLISLGF